MRDVENNRDCTLMDAWIKVKAERMNNLSSKTHAASENKKTANVCGFPGCDYVSDNVTAEM